MTRRCLSAERQRHSCNDRRRIENRTQREDTGRAPLASCTSFATSVSARFARGTWRITRRGELRSKSRLCLSVTTCTLPVCCFSSPRSKACARRTSSGWLRCRQTENRVCENHNAATLLRQRQHDHRARRKLHLQIRILQGRPGKGRGLHAVRRVERIVSIHRRRR
jgi:hypothetical protein